MITVEDTIQILAGLQNRKINIRLDTADIKLITSLGKQLFQRIPLTDRQLDLSLKKIEKYRGSLEKCQVNVDEILTLKPLRWPLRVIDRTQHICIEVHDVTKQPQIIVKYVFSKRFAELWAKIENAIGVFAPGDKGLKKINYSENNLYQIVSTLKPLSFTVDNDVGEIYEKIEKILKNPENFVPCLDFVDDAVVIKNVVPRCRVALNDKIAAVTDNNLLEFIDYAKTLGISSKSQNLMKKISEISPSELITKISMEHATRYRVSPDEYPLSELVSSINILNQWPMVVVVEENNEVFSVVRSMIDEFKKVIPADKINVFFRLKNEQTDSQQFNQYVKDNHLNNYIDETTKVVFILRTRIPKPLLKANWHPATAVIASNHDFGRLSAYLNDFSTVYYYNNSITMRNSRLKGANKIVQL